MQKPLCQLGGGAFSTCFYSMGMGTVVTPTIFNYFSRVFRGDFSFSCLEGA